MRFKVEIDKNWHLTITTPGGDPTFNLTRSLEQHSTGSGDFPAPPVPERSADGPTAQFLAGTLSLQAAQDDVLNRRSGSSEAYGRYLFDTLLGTRTWTSVLAAAGTSPLIELALCWEENQKDLHRLPWEMMRNSDGYLVASRKPRIAITRMIQGAQAIPSVLDLPPRVLFVIGTTESDSTIRPGAEFLALLRQLSSKGRAASPRILEQSSPKKLRELMQRFKPQVVHFICHGDFDSTGRGFLQLQKDEPNSDERRFADQLLQDLDVNGTLPSIVVLSACHSGTTVWHGQQTAPLAAQLVRGGVPIVVAMAGRVSDLACRLFTRRFGESILNGEPLVAATAVARRAPFCEGRPPHLSIDWVYPALFMSENVPPDFAPTPGEATPDRTAQWVESFQLEKKPVFCARQEFFTAYDEVVGDGNRSVLAVYGESQMGKTRLLIELAAQALRDGNIPILLGSDSGAWEPPRTLEKFAEELDDAIVTAAEDGLKLQQQLPSPLQLWYLSKQRFTDPVLTEPLRSELARNGRLTPRAIKLALQTDLSALTSAARQCHEFINSAKGRAVLLLDEVHRYDAELLSAFFNDKLLGSYGLGSAAGDQTIPVVMTFSLSGAAAEILKPVVEKPHVRPWLRFMPILPFVENGEDLLAYSRILLHPFDRTLLPDFSDKRLAVSNDIPEALVRQWEANFRKIIRGRLSLLIHPGFYGLAMVAQQAGYLKPADDDDVLRQEGVGL